VAQEYDTYVFRTHTYTVGREAVSHEESVIRLLDILSVSATLKIDHNIIDKENPIN